MLDARKLQLIEMWIQGKSKSCISREIGVSRQTVYEWLQDPEVISQIEEAKKDLVQAAKNRLTTRLDSYLDRLHEIAMSSKDSRTAAQCLIYLSDKVLGKTAVEGSVPQDKREDNISDDMLAQAIAAVEGAKGGDSDSDDDAELRLVK